MSASPQPSTAIDATTVPVAEVRVEAACEGGVARVIVDKPKGNIFSGDVMCALTERIRAATDDPAVRLITLEAAGKHFSFGAAVEEHTPDRVGEMLPVLRELVMTIYNSPVPVAALVQGRCLGGAFEVVMAAHLVFATADARFAVPEIKLGVFPPVACGLLPLRTSQAIAERMILTGDEVAAADLLGVGFVHKVVDGPFWPEVESWFALTFGTCSAAALRIATRAARADSADDLLARLMRHEQTYLNELMQTHDANEGISAFMERRQPNWRHA